VFNHHDPRVPDHFAYLSRSVARFRLVLRAPVEERKFFLLCSLDCRFELETPALQQLFQAMCAHTSGFELLVARFIKPSGACADAGAASADEVSSTSGATLAASSEKDGSTLRIFDVILRGGHTGLFFRGC